MAVLISSCETFVKTVIMPLEHFTNIFNIIQLHQNTSSNCKIKAQMARTKRSSRIPIPKAPPRIKKPPTPTKQLNQDTISVICQFVDTQTLFTCNLISKDWYNCINRLHFYRSRCLATWKTLSRIQTLEKKPFRDLDEEPPKKKKKNQKKKMPEFEYWKHIFITRSIRDLKIEKYNSSQLNHFVQNFMKCNDRESFMKMKKHVDGMMPLINIKGFWTRHKFSNEDVQFIADSIVFDEIIEEEFDGITIEMNGELMNLDGELVRFRFHDRWFQYYESSAPVIEIGNLSLSFSSKNFFSSFKKFVEGGLKLSLNDKVLDEILDLFDMYFIHQRSLENSFESMKFLMNG